jgi:hypothetical protein
LEQIDPLLRKKMCMGIDDGHVGNSSGVLG